MIERREKEKEKKKKRVYMSKFHRWLETYYWAFPFYFQTGIVQNLLSGSHIILCIGSPWTNVEEHKRDKMVFDNIRSTLYYNRTVPHKTFNIKYVSYNKLFMNHLITYICIQYLCTLWIYERKFSFVSALY